MVNYLGKFLPNISQITSPLHGMLKKNIFDLQEIKKLITSPLCLKYYPNLPTGLKPDTSSEGLGSLLEQNHGTANCEQWFPIAFASLTFAPYENICSDFGKETLSIVFGTDRFHKYLYGHNFTVFNDFQPLKSIFFQKSITMPSTNSAILPEDSKV